MDQSASFRGMKQAIYHADLDLRATREGLWGGHLPAVSFYYQIRGGGSIEFSAVPVADMQGNREQDAFFRLLKLDASGKVEDVRYYDTYDVRPVNTSARTRLSSPGCVFTPIVLRCRPGASAGRATLPARPARLPSTRRCSTCTRTGRRSLRRRACWRWSFRSGASLSSGHFRQV